MKTFFVFFLLSTNNFCTTNPKGVFLCDSKGGKKYHLTEKCRGLSNCSYRIVKVTLEEAKRRGKTRCGWEK